MSSLRQRLGERRWQVGGALAAVALVVLALAVVGVLRPAGGPPPLVKEPAEFAVSPAGDDVPRLTHITVTFASPPAERAPERLLHVEPAPKGTYAWVTARTLLFQPEFPGLLRGATYTVRVPARPEAGLAQEVTKRFTVTGLLTIQQVIPGEGDTEVPLNAQIIVQFSRSVAPLTTLSAQRTDPVVSFEPLLQGKGEWLNTSLYRFVPKDLAPSTTYRLRVAKGLSSAADGVLQQDFVSTFTTILPGVARIAPDDNTEFASPRQQVVVTFNQAMERSAARGIGVRDARGAAVPGTIAWSERDTVATFTPAGRLGVKERYVVTVAKGLKGARGGETGTERISTFTTVGLPAVSSTHPANGATAAERFGVNLTFSNPMHTDSLEGKLSVSGFVAEDLDGNVFIGERSLHASVALRPSTKYAVKLAAGAVDRYGQVMGEHVFSFTTGTLPTSVSLALPGYSAAGTYSATAEPIVYFHVTNTSSVSFTLYPLTGSEGERLLHLGGAGPSFTPSQPPIRTWTETVAGDRDIAVLGATSLTGGGPLPKGYYFLRTSGQLRSWFAFAVVDTVIVTKLSHDELVAWAIDHDSGRPVGGVPIHAAGSGVSPAEVTTDADGLASFTVPAPVLGKNVDRSYVLALDAGGRLGVTSTRWQQGTSPYQFGLPVEYFAREWVGHLYTDRPIYRPGEAVEYKGVIRADDDAQYGIPSEEPPLELVIMNARGQEVRRHDVKLNAFGSFAGRFELPGDAPLGDYSVRIEGKRPPYSHGLVVAANSFLVAEFRKPEFQVEVRTARPSYVNGDAIGVETIATFFFGGAVAGAPIHWSALGDPFSLQVKGYERYSFADFDHWRQAVFRDRVRARGTATTDARGVASYSVPAALLPAEGAQRFTLSATVVDQNGQSVASSTTATVHPAELYAGIRPAQYVAVEGADARLDLVTVDVDGRVLAGRAVAVKVYERQWVTTKEQVPGGGRRYRSEPRDTLIATLPATTDAKGEATVTFRPRKPGTLRVVAEATDAKGRVARSATYLWVAGSAFASWPVTSDDTIALVADRERYEVGETAEVLVPAPFAGATGLVTVERGKVITRSVRHFATNSERLRIPITDRSVPNVFVSVVLYRAPTAADPVPRYKVGYVQLPVATGTRVLKVSVRPEREQARPGETVHYDIKVTDASGRGVKSEVSVAVVDKAVLSLQDERGPDGLRAFWFERGLGVSTASSMSISVDRANDVFSGSAKPTKGGATGGGLQTSTSVRQDFRNTAYWTAQLVTRDDGTVGVDVKMPDSLTTWRMQVRAISGHTMVGEGTNELVSTEPLLLRPALPRFLRVGDAAELRVLVRNATRAASDVEVTLQAEGVSVAGDLVRAATVAAGQSVVMSWPAKAEAEGSVRLTFSAAGSGGLRDAVTQELPVLLDVTPETTATGGIVVDRGALEAVYLPPFAITSRGSLNVSVQSALAGSMADELRWLAPHPYEGAEHVASRLMATLAVRRAERSARGSSTERDGRITSDLAGLVGRQRPDGGWAWCDNPLCASDPNVTGWALLALGEARRDGLTFDQGVLARATGYVTAYINRTTDVASPTDPNQKAFLLAALASAGGGDAALTPARALFEQQRARLSSSGRAYLVLALIDAGVANGDPQVRALLNDLAAATIAHANGNHWEDGARRAPFMTTTSTTALATLALARVEPSHSLLPQTVRWLVIARGAERWQTSIDRASAILALTTYAVRTGELGGDFGYRVWLGERELLAGQVKPGEPAKTVASSQPLGALTPGQVSLVTFERDHPRPGRLYYTLNLRYVTPAKEIEALNRGFAISRAYTSLNDPSTPLRTAKLGDTVRVKVTVILPADRNYVVVEDLLPAGLEPVDARLRTVDPALKARLEADRAQAARRRAGGYVAPWFGWYYSPWQHVDLRDDRAVLYAERLAKGIYEYVYYARATTPGDFFVAPAHAEETYFPDVFGRSDSGRFVVEP